MGIMTIRAAHLSFPERVVVGHAELTLLGLVTLQTGFVALRGCPQHHIGFRRHGSGRKGAASRSVEIQALTAGLQRLGVDLVTIDAADVVRRMRSARPVANPGVPRVAAQAHPIRLLHGAVGKADDLGDIAATVDVEAAVAVAVLALHSLLLVVSMLEVLRGFLMARGAGLAPYARSAGYFDKTGKSVFAVATP